MAVFGCAVAVFVFVTNMKRHKEDEEASPSGLLSHQYNLQQLCFLHIITEGPNAAVCVLRNSFCAFCLQAPSSLKHQHDEAD